MANNSFVRFVKNNNEFQEEILTKSDLIYLSEYTDLKNFWHNQLADGALSRRGLSLFISEYEFFNNYFCGILNKDLNEIFKKGYYFSEFSNPSSEIGCGGGIYILGRYFLSRTSNVSWGSQPRGVLSKKIHDLKETNFKNDFNKWGNEIVKGLTSFLDELIKDKIIDEKSYDFQSEIMKKDYGRRVVLTAIPNSNGENRFRKFLNDFNSKYKKDGLVVIDDFFLLNKDTESTRTKTYIEKKEMLKNLYMINKKYHQIINKNTSIIIIDDVLTSGSHFESCVDTLKNTFRNSKYDVYGVFVSATQRRGYINTGNIKFKNPSFEILN